MALARLLAGTGYAARQVAPTAWRIERIAGTGPRGASPPAPDTSTVPEIVAAEPIIVTAPKRAAPLDELPMAVAVVRPEPMQAASATSGTAMIAAQSEGLAMTSLGPGRNRLFLRGIADSPFNGESQSTVAVVFDETRLTYAAPDPDIRLVDVERVEVLKGPQGSLYGTGALGGIYHIVPRHAELDTTSLALAAGGERIAHGNTGWNGSAVGNLPVVQGSVGLRLVGYAAREAGWVDTGRRRDSNETDVLGARANLHTETGDGWRADLSGLLQLLESRDSRYVYKPGMRTRPAQLPEPHDNDMRHLSIRLAREGRGLDIKLSTGISWHEVGDTLDATVGAGGFGLAQPKLLHDERLYRVWDSEARLGGHAGSWRWLMGLSYVEAQQKALWTLESFFGATAIIDDDRRDTKELALFGDVTVPLGQSFSLDAGARLFRSTVIETRTIAAGRVNRDLHRTGVTPSFALSWKPQRGRLLFLRYGSAYRPGGSDIGDTGILERLKSDELQTFEAGWRQTLGKHGQLDLGVFASRWENLQSDVLEPNGLIESANAGNARILGVDATLVLPLTTSLRLEAGGTFTDARLTRNMLGTKLDDRRLPVVPKVTARMALDQAVSLGSIESHLRVSARYVGRQRLSFDPVIDRAMGSYVETRIEVQSRFRGGIRMSLTADNLLGGAQDNFAFGNPLRFAMARQYTPRRPASLSAIVAAEF